MRKTLIISLAAAASTLAGGAALAQVDPAPGLTRAQVEKRASERFDRMDANADGRLDQADREARQTALFERIDADGNGAISRDEFASAGTERREAGAELGDRAPRFARRAMRAPGMARAADTDRDGAITEAEFTTAALERFERADADKDGRISREERRAQRRAHRGEPRSG